MFKIGGEGAGTPATLFPVPALGPGDRFDVERTATLIPQNYLNTATADWDEDVAESNETNNTTTDSYTVVAAELVWTVLTLPAASVGTLKDSTGTTLAAAPIVLPDSMLTFVPAPGVQGETSFSYQVENTITVLTDTGIVDIVVSDLFTGSCVIDADDCDDGRP